MRRRKLRLWSIGALVGIGMILSLTLHTAAISIARPRLTPVDRQAAQAMYRISQRLIQELSVPRRGQFVQQSGAAQTQS